MKITSKELDGLDKESDIIPVKLCAGDGKGSIITIIAIVVPIAGVLVAFFIGFFFLRRKLKIKKYLSVRQDGGNK